MSSPRILLLASAAALAFGPGLISPSQPAAANGLPLVVAQSEPAAGQDQDGMPDQPAPPKPYKPISVKPPKAVSDAGFEAFRKKLADVVGSKDKEALKGLIAAKVFHLDSEGNDKADKDKAGVDYFSELLDLDGDEMFGWDALAGAARDPTADPLDGHEGVICGPGAPTYDEKAFDALVDSSGTDEFEWAYTAKPLEVRSSDKPNAPVLEKVGAILLRILPAQSEDNGDSPSAQSDMIPVVVPSGKTGYVSGSALKPLSSDQLCYGKEDGNWKIVGYVGAE